MSSLQSNFFEIFGIALVSFFASGTWASGNSPRCFDLSTGEHICEPFQVLAGSEMVLFGEVDYDVVASEVEEFGLEPIALNGNAVVAFDFVDYSYTNIGSYREFIVMYAVQGKSVNLSFRDMNQYLDASIRFTNDPQRPNVGYFIKKMILDGPQDVVSRATMIGREGYGFPKERGHIRLSMDYGSPRKLVEVSNEAETWHLSFDMRTLLGGIFNADVKLDQYEIATGLGHSVWTVARRNSLVSRPMETNLLGDSMQASGEGDLVELFDQVHPWRWVYSPKFTMRFATATIDHSNEGMVIKSDFPGQIKINNIGNKVRIWKYAPDGSNGVNYINISDDGTRHKAITVSGDSSNQKCREPLLGYLIDPIRVTFIDWQSTEQTVTLPAGAVIYGCLRNKEEISQVVFRVPKNLQL